MQVAEVAVDVETGEVRVDRVAAIHDVGRVINPLGASSQVEGGIIQGIGHTLSEERLLDPETGVTLTQTLDAYKMPTIADVPEIVSELLDVPDRHLTNLGSKGLGEPPIVPVAAAIANAIRDATGADIRSLPITREEMLRALEEREAQAAGTREGHRVTLDVFLESARRLRPRRRRRRRSRGTASRRTRRSTTADGGDASVTLDDDGCVFVVKSLTQELAQILFDVARERAIWRSSPPTARRSRSSPATPRWTTSWSRCTSTRADELYEALRQSVTRQEEARGARQA